jgi:hypothetical protein
MSTRALTIILVAGAMMLAVGVTPAQALLPRQEGGPPGAAPADSRREVERPRPTLQSLGAAASTASEPLGRPFTIRADPEQEVYPSIAYNSQRQEYLVVWYNDRPGNDDIRAQRVSKNGVLIGGPFYVSAMNAERRYPDVAYNSAHDQYLVVWEQYEASSGYSIKGRRVSGTGAVLDTADITIRGPGSSLYTPISPAVAYASTSDRYLVVWAETWHPMPITYDIVGQVMTDAGALDGSQFSISTGSDSREEPDVAYNRHANRYLVVWQQKNGTMYDVHGQQVHGGGGLYQGDITIAYYIYSSTSPAVAAIPTSPTTYTFMVAWEFQTAPSDMDIYGALVAENGTLGTDFWVAWDSAHNESSPAIAGDELAKRYMVVWRYARGVVDVPVCGYVFSHAGALLGQLAEFTGAAADRPAVASGPAGDFMVAWQDQPVGATDDNLYGQLWGNRVYLPLILRNK